ncbi:MAG: TonB-dependent receptor [Bryobacteraceae bacterium]|nr:TonB-dependent receptor [Bryobacteraceae bacterium]
MKHLALLLLASTLSAQSLGNAGRLEGRVIDPSGAAVAGALVEILNPLTNYRQTMRSEADGGYRFRQLPFNQYHLEVTAPGFAPFTSDFAIRSAVPLNRPIQLKLAAGVTSVEVEAFGADLLENVHYAHNDMDAKGLEKMALFSPASGLSDALTLGSPGVVADANGFFHPIGDHAQTSFVVDGQPVNDQQSKAFSTQLPVNAIQSLEVVTGAPSAEYGDKTALVVAATTKSGLGRPQGYGSLQTGYGSFGTTVTEGTLGAGNARFGNFLAVTAGRSGRFLDTPEFRPIHAIGDHQTIFDRVDYQPNARHAFHLNILGGRNSFQVPNTYDQPMQDQRQRTTTANVGFGWIYSASPSTLLTVNPFVRQDRVHYFPSSTADGDTPITLGQDRHLTNWGNRVDLSHVAGRHTFKAGYQGMQTRLVENFFLGVTDPDYNPPNSPDVQPGLLPYDLTRGGRLFRFHGRQNINQNAVYAQDQYRLGGLNITLGFRYDRYQGIVNANGIQPRAGLSYQLKATGTVLRAAFSRTFETPYNENLILSSSTGAGGGLAQNVAGADATEPIRPGNRNQYNVGFQQALGSHLIVEGDYFWKFTRNAFDFGAVLTTPLVFPISWYKSNISGFSLRLSSVAWKGFQGYWLIGQGKARFFGPSNGGLIFPDSLETGVFRIDHDQAFQSTTHVVYRVPKSDWFAAYTWRYDSGLVSGGIDSRDAAFDLTAAQQAAMGLYCGATFATRTKRLKDCDDDEPFGALRYRIPVDGTANADHRPARVAPRHLHTLSVGNDNLWRAERWKMTARFNVVNLANTQRLYNFLSPFGGTHFVTPRAFSVSLGMTF